MHLFGFLARAKSRPVATATAATATPGSAPPLASVTAPLPPAIATPVPPGPEELRRLIFSAVASGDAERLGNLCRDYEKGMLEYAGDWAKVPEELQANPAATRWYGEGLRVIARYCAESLDRPDLFQRLEELGLGTPGVN